MGKGKPRHNPYKYANTKGNTCQCYREFMGKFICCEGSEFGGVDKCEGNPHNCIKQKYKAIQLHKKRKSRWNKYANPNTTRTMGY